MTHRKRRTSNIVECRSNSWRFIFHLEPSCLSSVKLPSSCPSNPHMSHTMSILPLPQEPNLPKKNMATSEFSKRFGGESSSVFFSCGLYTLPDQRQQLFTPSSKVSGDSSVESTPRQIPMPRQ